MHKRKLNVGHLLLVIMVILIGVFLIACFAIDLFGSNKEDDDVAYATSTPVITAKPIETEELDFYVEPSQKPTPSAKPDTKQADTFKNDSLKEEKTENKSTDDVEDTNGLTLSKTYDNIRIRNGIAITAKATSGSIKVVLTDKNGNQKVAFDQNGPFNTSENCDAESGIYTVSLYTRGNDWSWSYSLY